MDRRESLVSKKGNCKNEGGGDGGLGGPNGHGRYLGFGTNLGNTEPYSPTAESFGVSSQIGSGRSGAALR